MASSSRRRPGTRRRCPLTMPAPSGLSRSRRARRNSPSWCAASTSAERIAEGGPGVPRKHRVLAKYPARPQDGARARAGGARCQIRRKCMNRVPIGGRGRTRRLVLILATAAASWCAGSTVLTSSASAGGIDANSGVLTAAVYNVTPYTMTLVQSGARDSVGGVVSLQTIPAATVAPGGASLFALYANYNIRCGPGYQYGYDGYFTYRVDPLGAPSEYLTVAITQLAVSFDGTGCGLSGRYPEVDVYVTSAPPPAGWNPADHPGTPPAAGPSTPQTTYTHNTPTLFDQSFSIAGNWTVDAQSPLGRAFDDMLNAFCSGTNPNCSFTQTA